MPKITVRFYHVEPAVEGDSFASLLKRVSSIPIAQRTRVIRGYDMRLHEMHTVEKKSFITGDVLKIRMSDAPSLADKRGPVSDIPFKDTQGAGEHNAFMYCEDNGVLAYQTGGASGTSVSAFLDYLSQIDADSTGEPRRFEAHQLVHAATIEQLREMSRASTFEYKVAMPDPSDVDEFVSNNFGERFQTHVFSVGSARGSLDTTTITSKLKKLLRIEDGNLIKANVRGADADGKLVELQFVDGRSKYTEQVNPPPGKRNVPYTERRRVLFRAWDNGVGIMDGL